MGAVGGERSLLLFLVSVLGGTGCGPVVIGIDYRPFAAAPPPPAPAASVVLQVRNVRGSERGGQTERVGTIYNHSQGLHGGPVHYDGRPINATTPDAVADTVRAATVDALRHAGVSLRGGGPTLIASVREYWVDGPTIYRAFVVVAYDLVDDDGRIRWHADARGDSSVMVLIGNGLVKNFRAALLQVAQQAGDAFRTPAFWAALRGGGA
jgi:hypothetical protein